MKEKHWFIDCGTEDSKSLALELNLENIHSYIQIFDDQHKSHKLIEVSEKIAERLHRENESRTAQGLSERVIFYRYGPTGRARKAGQQAFKKMPQKNPTTEKTLRMWRRW